jgi:hypothetical protein
MTAEESRAAADAVTDGQAADAGITPPAPPRPASVVPVASRAPAARSKKPVAIAAAPRAPLVIAQADQGAEQTVGVASDDRLTRDPDSLLAKTLDLKDHVVAATRHVVAAIGDVFASVGEHIGGIGGAATSVRPFNSAS